MVTVGHVYVVESSQILVLGLGFHWHCTLCCHMSKANQVAVTIVIL